MFADDTNIFITGNNIKSLFVTMNEELKLVNDWFRVNKLSLNESKTVYTLFHSSHQKDNIPLKIPLLKINNHDIKRVMSTKFLGVMLDENLCWKAHINLLNSKISKAIGVMYKSRNFLTQSCLINLYFALIHCYLNYANIAWGSTHKSKLNCLHIKQKHAIRIIADIPRLSDTKTWFKKFNILNIYQINLVQHLIFMYKSKQKLLPALFSQKFNLSHHKYETRSRATYRLPLYNTKKCRFSITYRAPRIWNEFSKLLSYPSKSIQGYKIKTKKLILNSPNDYFIFF